MDVWKNQPNEIASVLVSYYQDLFNSLVSMTNSQVLNNIPRVATNDVNLHLTSDFLESEVANALQQIATLKYSESWCHGVCAILVKFKFFTSSCESHFFSPHS